MPESNHHALPEPEPDISHPVVAALELLPLPMWIVDRSGRMRWLNRAGDALLAAEIGAHFSRFVDPDGVNDARELFARTLVGTADATVQQTVLLTAHGPRAAEVTSAPLREADRAVGVLSVARFDTRPRGTAKGSRALPALTPRQHEVLTLLAQGLTTPQIAADLGIAEETARNHVRMLLGQLGVHTRLAAVVVAFRNGWL